MWTMLWLCQSEQTFSFVAGPDIVGVGKYRASLKSCPSGHDNKADIASFLLGCQSLSVNGRMIIWLLLVLAVVAIFFALALSPHSELNRAGLFGSNGRIDSGKKFGVRVGAHYKSADRTLRAFGFEQVDLTKAQSCHGFTYQEDKRVQLWFDKSWRKVAVCAVSSGDRVIYLSWSSGIGHP